jgi:drug/metabolite transporter (DMT)-like permease
MLPTLVLGGILTCLISFTATWHDPFINLHDLLLCFVWGALISGLLGNWLFIMAARHLAVAEATLIMLTEFVLAPVWVWWFVDEVPSRYTLIGGVLVLGAVAARALKDLFEASPRW